MKIDVLGKLFGSLAKVKIIRLFLFNADLTHTLDDVSKKAKVLKSLAKKEIGNLEKMGLLKKRLIRPKGSKSKISGYILNKDFYYLPALQNILVKIPQFTYKDIEKKFKDCGNIKLLVVSGVFIQNWESVADIVIVGERLSHSKIDRVISAIESEIGKELSYAVFDTEEFKYRLNVYDKFARDVLDFPHHKIINKLGLS